MKPGFDAILWLLIAGTASLIIWLLFTSLGSGAYPFPPPIPTIDPSPPPDSSPPSTKPTTPDLHTPSTSSPSTRKLTASEFSTSKGCTRAASLLISSIDPEIDPCDDFYQFSCGSYFKDHPLPRGTFRTAPIYEAMDRFKDQVIEHLLAVPLNNKSSIADKKVARFFELCLDADRDGIKMIATQLQELGGPPFQGNPRPELAKMIELLKIRSFPLWNVFKAEAMVLLGTPQLLLPARLRSLKAFLKEETKLLARDMETTVNEEILNSQLDDHVKLLTAIEKVKSGNLFEISLKGRQGNNFVFRLEKMEETFPGIPWKVLAESLGRPHAAFAGDLNYTRGIHELWKNGVLNEKNLKEWYISAMLDPILEYLGAAYRDLYEDKFGIKRDLVSFCFLQLNQKMPRWLDAFFAEKSAKLKDYTELRKLTVNMKEAWLETMRENDWIEPETKENITRQMAGVEFTLGITVPQYSQERLDRLYSLFDPNDSPTFFEFLGHIPISEIEEQFPDSFDPTLSYMVNAFNGPSSNGNRVVEILAGHMEEPFYADDYPLEYKYGVMGFTVGHELTHTFDPNVLNRSLLVGDDPQQYEEKVECIVDQFGNVTYPFTSFDDTYNYDGKQVRGETTSDNTGLRSAFRAYRKERARLYGDYPAKLPGLDEYTNDQLFFMSFAHDLCLKQTDRGRLDWFGDIHPLHRTRVNEGVKNFEAFSDAFSCKPNSPMNPPKKCRIWRHRHRRQ